MVIIKQGISLKTLPKSTFLGQVRIFGKINLTTLCLMLIFADFNIAITQIFIKRVL